MNMQKLVSISGGVLTLMILTGMTLTGNCTTLESIGLWAGEPIQIDGNIDDWKGLPTAYYEDEGIVLGIRNDSTYLYLLLRIDDPMTVGIIRRMGMQLWLDAKGKKKKNLGLRFQGGPSGEEIRESGMVSSEDSERQIPDERMTRQRLTPEFTGDHLTIFDNNLEFREKIAADGSNGPHIQYSLDQGFCNYEIKIPLEEHRVDYYGMNAEPGKKISVGIEIGGRPKRDDSMGGRSGLIDGGFPEGMGRGGGMGGGGRKSGSGMGSRMQLPEKKEVWLKTKLAVSAESKQ
jgi:hypothetical protein